MSEIDVKKFNRILNIYVQLQSRNFITAQQFANRYQVSLRTIYRDIKALEQAGVPVYNEAGRGYALVEGYRIPPTIFTKEEALSFVIAEKLMEKYADKSLSFNFSSALHKMKAILRSSEKEDVALIEDQFLIFDTTSANNTEVLTVLLESIVEQFQIEIVYQKPASDFAESRLLEAIGIFYENDYWYFMAYCHLRNTYRQFRIDRVQKIIKKSKNFTKKHQSLNYFLKKKKENSTQKITVKILTPKKTAHYFNWDKASYGFVSEKIVNDTVELTFETSTQLHYFARWFLMYSTDAEIVEPLALKQIVKELLQKALNKL